MKSMTGFAFAKNQIGQTQVSIEIKSYNNRFLEIFCNLPPHLSCYEMNLRRITAEKFRRGKIEINIKTNTQNDVPELKVNVASVIFYLEAAKTVNQIMQEQGLTPEAQGISVAEILNLDGVLESDDEKNEGNENELWNHVEESFKAALKDFEFQRLREGEHTKQNIINHLQRLESSLEKINIELPKIEENIKTNLKKRFDEICSGEIEELRLNAEIASLLMKWTIAEEVSRLQAHFFEFNNEIKSDAVQGKKLDFLCQEINREVNTIGSKTPLIEVSKEVILMKDSLENIREQLRNIE
ncbi:MAG: YicC family protein [Termitinemataceae bacterium]|nr:MAG: YicC family protein [Termitinemataceae bacterium]